jgi:hypothetical protein
VNTTTVTARPAARLGGRANTLLWAAQIVLAGTAELAGAAGLLIPRLAGSPRPGSPLTWPARPSSTPLCCIAPLSR